MIKLSDIYYELENIGAEYFAQCPLEESDATTIKIDDNYAIFVDESRFEKQSDMKAAITHEMGHCATGTTHKIYSPFDLIGKHEAEANRWSFKRFLPFEVLNKAVIKNNLTETWELAEYFDISEDYIRAAIDYYTQSLGYKFGTEENFDNRNHYREILKENIYHISFSETDMTIEDLSEEEAKSILDALCIAY